MTPLMFPTYYIEIIHITWEEVIKFLKRKIEINTKYGISDETGKQTKEVIVSKRL